MGLDGPLRIGGNSAGQRADLPGLGGERKLLLPISYLQIHDLGEILGSGQFSCQLEAENYISQSEVDDFQVKRCSTLTGSAEGFCATAFSAMARMAFGPSRSSWAVTLRCVLPAC